VPPLTLLHRDRRFVAIDKPAGVSSVPDGSGGPTVPELLAAQGLRALPVHRLDREVSGVLLVALDEEMRDRLQDLFRQHAVRKVYWAMAVGQLEPPEGKLTFPLLEEGAGARVSARGKPARTLYRTLVRHPAASELELELVTGRKNQIRVHLAHAGHPLVGERKYARGRDAVLRLRSRRVALHAWRLACPHPEEGSPFRIEAPLPPDLEALRLEARG